MPGADFTGYTPLVIDGFALEVAFSSSVMQQMGRFAMNGVFGNEGRFARYLILCMPIFS